MRELKIGYSFDYLREVFKYILVPVFIVILIVIIGLFIYSKKEKDHTTERYEYTINFWSYLMCILLSATLFAIAISFVVSLHISIAGRPVDKTNLIYIVYLSPFVPLAFLISTSISWIKMFLSYKEQNKEEYDQQVEELKQSENSEEEESILEPMDVEKEPQEIFTPIPVDDNVPSLSDEEDTNIEFLDFDDEGEEK